MVQSREPEPRIVKVSDIVEFPTELGNRCLLLLKLGLNAYWNSEEEILEALTESAKNPEMLDICLTYSRCRKFREMFDRGSTPFSERDPIRLLECEGRFWAVGGKHRICLAKRAGIEKLEAIVHSLPEDTESLLEPEGEPGRYCFSSTFDLGPGGRDAQGTLAYLWVNSPRNLFPGKFDFCGAWLDAAQNTGGALKECIPGLQYRVSVYRKPERQSFSKRIQRLVVESEIIITPEHPKTKIWVLEIPAAEASVARLTAFPSFRTVYRYGCWRRFHLKQLSRMWLRFF